MKARAGLFTLLISMMCLVGFGAVTADLDQNSAADYEMFYDMDSSVNVAIAIDFPTGKSVVNTTDISCMECHFIASENTAVFDVGKSDRADETNYNYKQPEPDKLINDFDIGFNRFTELFKEADLAFERAYSRQIRQIKLINKGHSGAYHCRTLVISKNQNTI